MPRATQVKHILGAAAHAALAAELNAGNDKVVGERHLGVAQQRATPVVIALLRRYPPVPGGGGRVGELLRQIDTALRALGARARPGTMMHMGRVTAPQGLKGWT